MGSGLLQISMTWSPMPFKTHALGAAGNEAFTVSARTITGRITCSSASMDGHFKVVGVGSCGLDYLAQIAAWPNPDDKLRTESLKTQGGGNCANALTAAARLGLRSSLVSKIGDDGIGDQIISELHGDGVQTTHLLRAKNKPSPFTYIIVDRAGGTRTCIHTPSEPMDAEELQPLYEEILANAAVVYFDGRLTEAAVPVARAARNAGISVLVEAERLRPHLEELLAEADFVSTSAKFPQAWTGEASLGAALHAMLQRLPLAKWTLTTLGVKGAVMLQRCPKESITEEADLDEILTDLRNGLPSENLTVGGSPACTCKDGTEIWEGQVRESSAAYRLRASSGSASSQEAAQRAELSAAEEAHRNAAGGNAEGYRMHSAGASWQPSGQDKPLGEQPSEVCARVIISTAAQVPQDKIRDTTGAGDATVGTLLYGICHGLGLAAMMRLAAIVSAAKCTAFGARTALPHIQEIREDLLR